MALTTAIVTGTNNAAIAGPNGGAIVGTNYVDPWDNFPQSVQIPINRNADLQASDSTYVKANAGASLFTRSFNNTARSYFSNTSAAPRAIQYTNFITATSQELQQWESNGTNVDAYKMVAPDGTYYEDINDGNETLMDFTNTDWLDFRLSTIPEWSAANKLGNVDNLDALSMDLSPLWPMENLVREKGNPFATSALWKTNMLAYLEYVRDRIDNDIYLFANSLRQFWWDIDDFRNNPADYEDYDGTDACEPGVYGSVVGIEAGLDYNLNDRNQMLYTLRALYRGSAAGKSVAPSMKVNTSARQLSEEENQRRINNLCAYALIHEPTYTRFSQRSEETFAPYPLRVFSEMDIVLGTPDTAVDTVFTDYSTVTAQLFTRAFNSGNYTVLFNWSNATVGVPETYQSGYQQIRTTRDVQLDPTTGTTESAIEYVPVGETLGPWQGMLLFNQVGGAAGLLTVTSGSLVQLQSEEVRMYFGVGETGMMLDTGEFSVGYGRSEVMANLDLQDGDHWEISVQGKDQPGVRDSREGSEYIPTAAGAQNSGSGGRGRFIRVILRALAPLLHRIGSAEVDIRPEDRE